MVYGLQTNRFTMPRLCLQASSATLGAFSLFAYLNPRAVNVSSGTPENNFVQILNVSGNHWITVSDIDCPMDTAVVYDSLHCGIESSYQDKFLCQMGYMLMPRSRHVTLLTADIQKQEGNSDCGLFAVAVATSLCCDVLPQDNTWKQSEMHKHLARFFIEGVLTEFPMSSRSRDHQCYFDSWTFEVFCHCRQPYITRVYMVQCNECLDWFHWGCEKISRVVRKNTIFFMQKL